MRKIYLVMLVGLIFQGQLLVGKTQTDSAKYLLNNFALQIEITDAVDHMYNFNFNKAEVEFNGLR